MKPPGGESKLNIKEDEDGEVQEEELEERCVRWEDVLGREGDKKTKKTKRQKRQKEHKDKRQEEEVGGLEQE